MQNKIKSTLKLILKVIAGFIVFVLVYLLAAFCLSRITVEKEPSAKEEITIYIKTNGVHTDIVVPVQSAEMNWSKEVSYLNTISKDTTFEYLAMGWGDKGFYLQTPNWSDLKMSVAFNAAFGLSSTAIHATFYHTLKEDKTCKKITLSREQYARLVAFIVGSFKTNNEGHFIPIATHANYGKNDAFYEANGSYSLFHTCNTWANKGLKTAGQKCCLWTPFDTGIFLKYEK